MRSVRRFLPQPVFFIILVGSLFFTRFLALSGVPSAFANMILSVSSEPWWILLAVTILYVVLGMLIDSIGLLLLTLPLILPLVGAADMNPIWFGIIIIKLLEIGLVTTTDRAQCLYDQGIVGGSCLFA